MSLIPIGWDMYSTAEASAKCMFLKIPDLMGTSQDKTPGRGV